MFVRRVKSEYTCESEYSLDTLSLACVVASINTSISLRSEFQARRPSSLTRQRHTVLRVSGTIMRLPLSPIERHEARRAAALP